ARRSCAPSRSDVADARAGCEAPARPRAAPASPQRRSCRCNSGFQKTPRGVWFFQACAAVPTPARNEDRIDALAAHEVADREARQLGVAAPFALARHDEVQIELPNQRHAMSACLVVDT